MMMNKIGNINQYHHSSTYVHISNLVGKIIELICYGYLIILF